MADPFVDTNVLIRLLTGDDPVKQAAARQLFEAVERGDAALAAPDTVIADAVYVLASPRLYRLPRSDVRDLLTALVRLPGFHVDNRAVVLDALDLYASTNLDFGDAMIVSSMARAGSPDVYSFDFDFDRIPGVVRRSP